MAVRFLADENLPAETIAELRAHGFEVVSVSEEAAGSPDEIILGWAQRANLVLLTLDKDFGELAFASGLLASSGVVLFRFRLQSPGRVAARVVSILESRTDWPGHFSVADEDNLRMTRLPE